MERETWEKEVGHEFPISEREGGGKNCLFLSREKRGGKRCREGERVSAINVFLRWWRGKKRGNKKFFSLSCRGEGKEKEGNQDQERKKRGCTCYLRFSFANREKGEEKEGGGVWGGGLGGGGGGGGGGFFFGGGGGRMGKKEMLRESFRGEEKEEPR